MKHLDLWSFWLREKVTQKIIRVGYVPTKGMPADLLTKALPHKSLEQHQHETFLTGSLTLSGGHVAIDHI